MNNNPNTLQSILLVLSITLNLFLLREVNKLSGDIKELRNNQINVDLLKEEIKTLKSNLSIDAKLLDSLNKK